MKGFNCLVAIFLYCYLYEVIVVVNVVICEVNACNLSRENRKVESLTISIAAKVQLFQIRKNRKFLQGCSINLCA